eukprot:TRINITY_DN11290_c0_g1_i3.p1 TRINITY_DN11290_c0_g1~~TRINITY_DN11290_c0_g1_i3.p1  ORF type:complete len:587 (+),score=100.04 TRINITY_DN11290_c0_g1_i3:61-1821(+)
MAGPIFLRFQNIDGSTSEFNEFKQDDAVDTLLEFLEGAEDDEKGRDSTGTVRTPTLLWQGSMLDKGITLAEAGVRDGAIIHVVWRARGVLREFRNCNRNVLPVRDMKDEALLKREMEFGGVDVSGCLFVTSSALLPFLSTGLRALDIRQCRMKDSEVKAVFEALPASLEELRASRNKISRSALESLSRKGLCFKALDIGYSECGDCTSLPRVVGERTEELVLGVLESLTSKTMHEVILRCPHLKKIDIYGYSCDFNLVLRDLSEHCLELEVLETDWCTFEPSLVTELVTKCRLLKVVALHNVDVLGTVAAIGSLPLLDTLCVSAGNAKAVAPIASAVVNTLQLHAHLGGEDHSDTWFEEASTLDTALATSRALDQSSASCIELGLPFLDASILRAAGPRLQGLHGSDLEPAPYSVLSLLKDVPECCSNLRNLHVCYWEHIDAKVLAVVAAACPLLEELYLNADGCEFQTSPIDEGIVALGKYCHNLVSLDLYDRMMDDAPSVLATACAGWPKLRYLCVGNVTEWSEADPGLSLPKALAAHCPLLETLDLYGDKNDLMFMKADCPLFRTDDDVDYDDSESDDSESDD